VLDPSIPLQHEELSNLAHVPTSIRSPLRGVWRPQGHDSESSKLACQDRERLED
jgi:hypothetical protein